MCGRYALKTSVPEIARILDAEARADFAPSYNLAPTQLAPVCRASGEGDRELVTLRWGLVPHWAKSMDDRYRMINARSETVASKPAFRSPFRRRRCLIPVDGYYEWKRAGNRKQPYFLHRPDESPFFLAGVWDRWDKGDGEPVESFAIITSKAAGPAAEVHDRMPAILEKDHFDAWLDPGRQSAGELEDLLKPRDDADLQLRPVSTYVNNPRNNDPRCTEALTGAC
ncbi:MAG: SOS response-associated peptidase [Gammaproteobacteria bacterium]|nr:SOS response-associated peptidase [Gammaproteobacteria bacterium]